MTIKKLTVAAAIAVGIVTGSLNQAMATCPCTQSAVPAAPIAPCAESLPVVTGGACPCNQPAAPTCNKCHKTFNDCDCNEAAPMPCGAAPCDDQCDPCKRKSWFNFNRNNDCDCVNDDLSCAPPAEPACAACAQTAKPSRKDMKQVYGYPNAVYGTNNYVGEPANSILSTEGLIKNNCGCGAAGRLSSDISGVTVASDGQITGAATQIPCLNEAADRYNGIPVMRTERLMDGNNCPLSIQTENSMTAMKKSFVPYDVNEAISKAYPNLDKMNSITGAAATMGGCTFPDVPSGHWAACDIDKLAINNVVVGYPDGMFKPNRNISRAEFATMLVKGFNLDCNMPRENLFKDVPMSNWANPAIAKAVSENLMKGYPNGKFEPCKNVTRAEALTTISKGMTCDIDKCKADEILSQYTDGASVPDWARISVAKSLSNGALKDSPNPKMIMPNREATRADVASMMQTVRVALGYDTNPKTANDICPVCPCDKKAFVEEEEIVQLPTLKIKMIDQITAKSSHVGQYFRAKTLEDLTINGQHYPCGSTVTGQVVEVVRPSGCDKGAIKLSFTRIDNGKCHANLPKQILTAQVNKSKQVNPVARLVEMPFTLAGSLVGVVGRTTGGMLSNIGNAAENVSNDAGYMLGHVFQGKFGAAARNLGDGIWETVKAPVDTTRTALSGTMGLFQTTGDEIAYLVDPKGYKISAVNPREHITIAFGCTGE